MSNKDYTSTINYKEILKISMSPWVDLRGIMILGKCGRCVASRIRNEIEKQIIRSGKRLPTHNKKYVPTRLVLEYLGLDEDYIVRMSNYKC